MKFVPSAGARTPISTNPVDLQAGNNRISPASDNAFGADRQPIRRNDTLTREDFGNPQPRTNQDLSLTNAKTDADRFFEQQRLLDRQREIDRQRELDSQTDLARQRELDQQRGLDRQRELDRQADLARQNEVDMQRELARRRELEFRNPVDTTRTFGIDRSRDNVNNPNTHTFELTDRDIDALATSTHQIRTERERREAELERMHFEKLAAERRAQQADAERSLLLDQLNGRSRLDQTSVARRRTLDDGFYTSYGQRNQFPLDRGLSRTTDFAAPFTSGLIDRYPDRVAQSDSTRLQLQEAALENERLRLQLARAETEQTRFATQNRLADLRGNSVNDTRQLDNNQRAPLNMRDYGASIPGSQPQGNRRPQGTNPVAQTSFAGTAMTTTAVDHILSSYDGQNFQQVASRVKGEVAAISAAKTRVDKFNGFLLFLFITFFALSLYLGWLAQSFYGQYGELADELRETFTATT